MFERFEIEKFFFLWLPTQEIIIAAAVLLVMTTSVSQDAKKLRKYTKAKNNENE